MLETVKSLRSDVRSMRETIDCQHTQICNLIRSNQRLVKENKELRQRLSKNEQPPQNSANGSTLLSKESLISEVKRRTTSLRPKSDRLIGRQIGHVGCTWETVDTPDEIIDLNSSYCVACGASLSEIDYNV